MIDMVKAMAGLGEEPRKVLLGERLRLFAEMPEAQRAQAMREMMSALVTLPREGQKTLIATRLAVLMELPDAQREVLMATHMQLMSGMPPEVQMGELEIVNELVDALPPQAHAMAGAKMGGMLAMLHDLHKKQGRSYGWCPSCSAG